MGYGVRNVRKGRNMEFDKVIRERTAVRKFKEQQIKKEELDNILEAGRLAPTAKNIQPQKIIVVQSKEGIEKIDNVTPCRYNAPTVLIVCSDQNLAFKKDDFSTYGMDACIVATHMMLEATNVDVGSIWIEYFDTEKVKQEFQLEKGIEPICLIPLGYTADDYAGNPSHNIRKSIEELVEYR